MRHMMAAIARIPPIDRRLKLNAQSQRSIPKSSTFSGGEMFTIPAPIAILPAGSPSWRGQLLTSPLMTVSTALLPIDVSRPPKANIFTLGRTYMGCARFGLGIP